MKTYRLPYIFLVLSILISLPAISQDKSIKAGDLNMKDLQYHQAIKNYTKAWEKFKSETYKKKRVAVKLADCYRLINNPTEAVVWYEKVADTKLAEKQPDIYYHYAEALRKTENCSKAVVYYQKFLKKKPDNILGKNGITSCKEFGQSDKRSRYEVTNESTLNSPNDDYAVCYSAKKYNQLFFTSNRKGSTGKDKDNWTAGWFSDIYMSNSKNEFWNTPVTADATGVINTEANEGTPVFNKKFSTMYFTRCNKGADRKVYCEIIQSDRRGQRWTKPKAIMSDRLSNNGQPAISKDELTLYFVSDREGGLGGKDIWMAKRDRKGKPFGKPVNLGSVINTPGDEMFPSLQDDTILCFSSNGHPGYGGLDIFKTTGTDTVWSEPENLLTPINSISDDFAIVFKNEKEGFLSSDRNGGQGGDDIYSFLKKKLFYKLDGIVKDERTLFTLRDVEVKLTTGEGTTSVSKLTNSDGSYYFDSTFFNEDKNYTVLFSKDNFFSVSYDINTFDYSGNHRFNLDVLLKPIPEAPIVLPDILYDLGKWDLKPRYQDSLMVLVKILKDNQGLVIELGSHTDSRASLEFNDELSQKRAQSVVDFLISKGINPERLIAKGYGERVPRKLEKPVKLKGYTFKAGSVLNEKFINSLSSNYLKESAHELNRRTEFKIIAKDFKPSGAVATNTTVVEIVNDSSGTVVPFTLTKDNFRMIDCYLNGFLDKAVINENKEESVIAEKRVIELMKQGVLSKKDFEGDASEILQNNRIKDGAVILFNELRISDKTIHNVRFVVKQNTVNRVTLGKQTLNRFGSVKFNEINKR